MEARWRDEEGNEESERDGEEREGRVWWRRGSGKIIEL